MKRHVLHNVTYILELIRLLYHFSHQGSQLFELLFVLDADSLLLLLVEELDNAS